MNDRLLRRLVPPAASPSSMATQRWRFASHEFDERREELCTGGVPIPLAPKPTALLKYFLQQPQRVIGKHELMTAIWGSTVVTDDSLVQLVLELRNALGDREQRIVKTVTRRGYLFDAVVEPVSQPPTARRSRWRGRLIAAGVVASVGAAGMLSWSLQSRHVTSIDEALTSRFTTFIAPLVEVDTDGEPSQFGRRIAADIATQLMWLKTRVLTKQQGANYVLEGRIHRRTERGVTVVVQMRELSTGVTYPLIQPSYASEEDALHSDLAVRAMRAMWLRRDEIILAAARQPGHRPDALELLIIGWNELNMAATDADVRRADSRFEAVLQEDPAAFAALIGRATACAHRITRLFSAAPRDELAACEQRARQLLASAPEDPDAMHMLAQVLMLQGRLDEAAPLARKSIALSPLNRSSNLVMAMVLVRQGRFDEARRPLEITRTWAERVQEHGPADHRRQSTIYQLFADAAFLRSRDDESEQWVRRWLAEMPDDGRPYLMLAALDALKGRDDEAREHMKRHRELRPRSTAAYAAMMYASADPAISAQRKRIVEAMKRAGLPD
jgi:DNA-binding winged helix-turn-helix (wHTH) protein/Flp pilus assembly protein TadD